MNKNKRALLFGMLLGDGCLKVKNHIQKDGTNSKYYEYALCHSEKQKEYLEYKRDLFHSLMGGKKPNIIKEIRNLKTIKDKSYIAYRFSRCHKLFRLFHKKLYSNNGKKYFTRQVLNYLNPESLAIWYMDDGGLSRSKRPDGSVSSCQTLLFTYCSEIEINTIITYFNEVWNLFPKKKYYKINNSWNICFNTKEGQKFQDLIQFYIIPSMKYKLSNYWITRAPDSAISTDDMV